MKNIIRWICRISGVETEIQKRTCKIIGNYMDNYSHSFTHSKHARIVLKRYSENLKEGSLTLQGNQQERIRAEVYNAQLISVYTNKTTITVKKGKTRYIAEYIDGKRIKTSPHGHEVDQW